METKIVAIMAGALFLGTLFLTQTPTSKQSKPEPLVRLAELEIDTAHLDAYKTALWEEIDASVRLEPGVLRLYAVSVKDHPSQIRLFEMYASPDAYQAHLETKHFRKYNRETAEMVKSLKLVQTEPILLGSK